MPDWLPAVAVLLSALFLSAHVRRVEAHMVEHFDRQVNHLKGVIDMSGQDTVNAVVAQIKKGTAEVVGKIAGLQAQVDAGVPAEELDLTELAAAAQALDDIVPDSVEPVDVPVDDVPVDDAPTEA